MSLPGEQNPDEPSIGRSATEGRSVDDQQKPVGYKSPPQKDQFKKSGNPGGRPKKRPAIDIDNVVITLLEAKLPQSKKTGLEALMGTLAKRAAQGDLKALKLLLDLYLDAKKSQRHKSSDLEADQQAAERLLASLGPLASEIVNAADQIASKEQASTGKDD